MTATARLLGLATGNSGAALLALDHSDRLKRIRFFGGHRVRLGDLCAAALPERGVTGTLRQLGRAGCGQSRTRSLHEPGSEWPVGQCVKATSATEAA